MTSRAEDAESGRVGPVEPITRRPESSGQAGVWDRVKSNAVEYGLCDACAARLAWAHQEGSGGFESIAPPCTACAPLVARLPRRMPSGWRTVAGSASRTSSWARDGEVAELRGRDG